MTVGVDLSRVPQLPNTVSKTPPATLTEIGRGFVDEVAAELEREDQWQEIGERKGGPMPQTSNDGGTAEAFVVRAGVDPNDPDAVRITYVLGNDEHLNEIAPPETPHDPLLDRLIAALKVPVDAVKAYRSAVLLEKLNYNIYIN